MSYLPWLQGEMEAADVESAVQNLLARMGLA